MWNDAFEHYVRSLTDEDMQRMKEQTATKIGWSVEDLDALSKLLEESMAQSLEERMGSLADVRTLISKDDIIGGEGSDIRDTLYTKRECACNKSKIQLESGIE